MRRFVDASKANGASYSSDECLRWRRKALEALPEFRVPIERASSPMALWIDLLAEFQDAVFHFRRLVENQRAFSNRQALHTVKFLSRVSRISV